MPIRQHRTVIIFAASLRVIWMDRVASLRDTRTRLDLGDKRRVDKN